MKELRGGQILAASTICAAFGVAAEAEKETENVRKSDKAKLQWKKARYCSNDTNISSR